jgi:hypothetical protein
MPLHGLDLAVRSVARNDVLPFVQATWEMPFMAPQSIRFLYSLGRIFADIQPQEHHLNSKTQ